MEGDKLGGIARSGRRGDLDGAREDGSSGLAGGAPARTRRRPTRTSRDPPPVCPLRHFGQWSRPAQTAIIYNPAFLHLDFALCIASSRLITALCILRILHLHLHLYSPTMIRFDTLPPEVMQAMCTPMHLILPASPQTHTGALYLGSFSAILDPALLSQNAVGALVQVLDAPWLPSMDAHAKQGLALESYRLDILDSTSADLKPHLEAAVRWIDDRLHRGVNVLVHCQQGVSRSAAIVIAYLIFTQNMSYDSAFDLVRRKRACVKPNSGFVRALQEWEKQVIRPTTDRPPMRRASTTPR
ncbi:hypothetical protein AcV7_005016 [Taiwanofungus camphoratus]|nr:hypothetical protein AcV7_005016 [Antrodia cinnamomea]